MCVCGGGVIILVTRNLILFQATRAPKRGDGGVLTVDDEAMLNLVFVVGEGHLTRVEAVVAQPDVADHEGEVVVADPLVQDDVLQVEPVRLALQHPQDRRLLQPNHAVVP